jgi:hypothetical protein
MKTINSMVDPEAIYWSRINDITEHHFNESNPVRAGGLFDFEDEKQLYISLDRLKLIVDMALG